MSDHSTLRLQRRGSQLQISNVQYTTRQVAAQRRWRRSMELPTTLLAILDGLVAGDGHLKGIYQTSYTMTSKYAEWIEHVGGLFQSAGLMVHYYRQPSGNPTFTTHSYEALTPFRRRWYTRRLKVLPIDMCLEPAALLYWYLGDGGLKTGQGGASYSAELSTYAFLPSSVVSVARRIESSLGLNEVRVYLAKAGPFISVSKRDTRAFLDYIGASPVRCYDYKWAVPAHTSSRLGNLLECSPNELAQLDEAWRLKYADHLEKAGQGTEVP